jgi:catechol 2,3-dioxygenase-like lactoylglutathione lyase family enzyme
MNVRLEHANLGVRDVDAMIAFVRHAFPSFRIRGEGKTDFGDRWVHVGSDATYLAFQEAPVDPAEQWMPYGRKPGTNHLGFEVDDVEALRQRLLAEGYLETTYPNAHPHRQRVYFHDPEGHDWEFVEYRSDDPAERNAYALPG